ncbi:helix-turn-helix transcriptional regulator [Marivita sp. S0852]|uniref:helix-turn-helix transcriptional regulator n=1 Tax=Marivita sp. S0852 TaxID=3373893 RepID=UPI003981E90E
MHATHSDETVLKNFKTNIEQMLDRHGMTPAELSQRAGFDDAEQVASILNGTTLPNMAVPLRLANALDVPVEVLLRDPKHHLAKDFQVLPLQDVDQQAARLMSAIFKAAEKSLDAVSDRPTMDSIIAWWKETGGDLAQCAELTPHVDLIKPAEADGSIPGVQHVGPLGLSAATLGSSANERMERFLASLNDVDLQELNTHIRSVSHSGVGMISQQTRVVELPELDAPLEISFVRLMLPVTDAFGQPYVLNYSTLLSESTPKRHEGRSLKN